MNYRIMLFSFYIACIISIVKLSNAAEFRDKIKVSYRCSNKSCTWNNYKKHSDWDFYSKEDDDCERCRMKCSIDPMCSAVECGEGYCSWWKVGNCRSSSEKNGYANTCYKQECKTVGGASSNVDCVFPFAFNNKVHYSCIYDSSTDGHPWCSTKVDENGDHISQQGHWGHCSNSCPVSSRVYEVSLNKGKNGKFGFTHTDGLIKKITKGSSADKANIEVGDLIFEVNGKRASEKQNVYKLMRDRDTRDYVELKLYRKDDLEDEKNNEKLQISEAGCDTVILNSSGDALKYQDDRIGLYKKWNSTIGGRLVYKHTRRKDYLYFVKHSSTKSGHWMVGPVPGNNWGGIRNKICDTVSFPYEPYCNAGWEYHDGNLSDWQSDSTIRIICQDFSFPRTVQDNTTTIATSTSRTTDKPATAVKHWKCGVSSAPRPSLTHVRIINGSNSRQHDWPWAAALVKRRKDNSAVRFQRASTFMEPFCSGAVISERFILTAGHCVSGITEKEVIVVLGQRDFRKKFVLENQSKDLVQIHKVQNIAIHPLYEPPPKPFHDIAILKIKSRNIEFTNFVKPICLPPPDGKLYTDDVAVALGWGSEYYKGPSSRVLQEISITVWDNIRCQKSWNRITNFTMPNTMLCAGGELGRDACQGDSGGPLNCFDVKSEKWELCGVISFGYRCGTSLPGIYTRVSEYMDWISSIIH